MVVAVRDEERGEVVDLLRGLAGGEPRQLDDARAVELRDALRSAAGGLHRQEAVVAVVDGDAEPLVERKAFAAHLGVEALDLDRGAHESQRAAGGVERAVAEELLEDQAVPLPDRVELALEQHHLAIRADFGLLPAAPQIAERL